MSDYTYRKIITDREGVATGEKILNVPDEVVKQIRAEAINDYDNKLNEKINTDTRFKDTIRKILDNVAHEMYYKGIDDLTEKLKEMANNSSTKYIRLSEKETITTYGVEQIAEELKAGD